MSKTGNQTFFKCLIIKRAKDRAEKSTLCKITIVTDVTQKATQTLDAPIPEMILMTPPVSLPMKETMAMKAMKAEIQKAIYVQ